MRKRNRKQRWEIKSRNGSFAAMVQCFSTKAEPVKLKGKLVDLID